MSKSGDMLVLADKLSVALDELRAPALQERLQRLGTAVNDISKAWSGSNLGYHANVYYRGLEPPPPGAHFSSEWGLGDHWPIRGTTGGWKEFAPENVLNQLFARAGNPNLDEMEAALPAVRKLLTASQEEAISILLSELESKKDGFIQRKLDEVQAVKNYDLKRIQRGLVPGGTIMTRDTTALTQGNWLAPHQEVQARVLLFTLLENDIETLETSVRQAASHMNRTEKTASRSRFVGTNVFIGHGRSPLWRELWDFIDRRLGLPVDEFNSVPVAGITTTARLSELLDAAAFAFLIMTAEDERADGKKIARTNVIHEVGLFQGRLGMSRAIVLLEEGCEEFSNIHGLGQIRFPQGCISAVFEDIRAVLEREGVLEGKI